MGMGGGEIGEFRVAWGGRRLTQRADAVGRWFGRRPFVVGLVGLLALLCASCAGGTQHLAAKPVHHKAGPNVKTDAATSTNHPPASTTTSTLATVRTNANTFTPAPQPAPPPTTTTTSTVPFPPGCVWSDFVAHVSTDQSSYSPGQPVQIALLFANTGPACTVNSTGYACPLVNIDNASGSLVWSSAAPVSSGCPSTFTGPTVLAANWSQSFSFSWAQTTCTPGQVQACPGPQVPAGQYQVVGMSGGGSSQIPAGAPVTINLDAANP
jgi:hypothetical protein